MKPDPMDIAKEQRLMMDDLLPVGLTVDMISQIDIDTYRFRVIKYYSTIYANIEDGGKLEFMNFIDLTDFHIIKSNTENVVLVCLVEKGGGIFDLTVKKYENLIYNSLSLGEYVDLNIRITDNSINTKYASGLIKLKQRHENNAFNPA